MSVVEFFSQPVWHRLSLTLVHFLWQGLSVAVVAYAAVRVPRLKRGNPRYGAYLLAFAVMAICPLVTFAVLGGPPRPAAMAPAPMPEMEVSGPVPRSVLPEPPEPVSEDALTVSATRHTPLRERLDGVLQASLPWALVCWMSGVLILSVRLLLGVIGIRRWRRNLEPVPDGLEARVALLSERLGMSGFRRVFVSGRALEVVALGYLRPMVLLPATIMTQMPPEMLEAVIAHELAHIRRFDLWVNLAQRIVETLLFYHPAVWWLSNRLRTEREFCCDEMAVAATGERLTYASALETAQRGRLAAAQPALALALGQSKRSTLSRVRHILGLPPAPADSRFWLAGAIVVVILAILAMPVASLMSARADSKTVEADEALTLELIEAAAAGDIRQVKDLIAAGADVNAQDRGDNTALHYATQKGHLEVVKLLVAHGADVNAGAQAGWTPLLAAANEGHEDIAEFLLKNQAPVDVADAAGYTPLYYAIWSDDEETVRTLIAHGADVNKPRKGGYSPLVHAVWQSETANIKALIDAGADVNVKDDQGGTPLYWAVDEGAPEVIRLFLEAGAQMSDLHRAVLEGDLGRVKKLVDSGVDVDTRDDLGRPLSYWALSAGQIDVFDYLLKAGADVTISAKEGSTLLHKASERGLTDVVRRLIAKGAAVNARTDGGGTPLFLAATRGHKEACQLLIVNGADVNAALDGGRHPLGDATARGHEDVVRLLLANGADVNLNVNNYGTALHAAVQRGRATLVDTLINHGADVNADSRSGTVLHLAAGASRQHIHSETLEPIIKKLLDHGADVHATDKRRGPTPLHVAARRGRADAARLLLAAGADVNAKDNRGRTPLSYAEGRYATREVAELLRKHGARSDTATANTNVAPPPAPTAKDKAAATAALFRAIRDTNIERMRLAINQGADLEGKNKDEIFLIDDVQSVGCTPLYIAAGVPDEKDDVVGLLLEAGANPNTRGPDGQIPLHAAAWGAGISIVEMLVSAGSDVNVADKEGRTPAIIAFELGHYDKFDLMVAHGATVSTDLMSAYKGNLSRVKGLIENGKAQERFEQGLTLLHAGAAGGHTAIVELLLTNGLDVHSETQAGYTALHYAAAGNHREAAELLLAKGADVNAEPGKQTPLHWAIGQQHKEMIEWLLARGANPNADGGDYWGTPLHWAVWWWDVDTALLLVSHGGDIHLRTEKYPYSPLFDTVVHGNPAMAQALVTRTGDRKAAKWAPLLATAASGDRQATEDLLAKGADVNAESDRGLSALHAAAVFGHKDVARLLIEKGADVNAKAERSLWDEGMTALHGSCIRGQKGVAELLIAEGADVNARTKNGYTPLHIAATEGYGDLAELLIAKGAHVNAKNNEGQTPLSVAEEKGHTEIVELLRKHGAKGRNSDAEADQAPAEVLYRAVTTGNTDTVAEPTARAKETTSVDEGDAADASVTSAELKYLERLREAFARGVDVDARDSWGHTILHRACMENYPRVAEFLIDKGADVNARNITGITPLHTAAGRGHAEVVRLLLDKKADINARDDHGATPLWYAKNGVVYSFDVTGRFSKRVTAQWNAENPGCKRAVELLVERGAEEHAPVMSLHEAAHAGLMEKVKSLVAEGADVNAMDDRLAATPLHLAAYNNQTEVVEFLIAHGADVNARNKWDRTPLHIAIDQRRTEIAELLRQHGATLEPSPGTARVKAPTSLFKSATSKSAIPERCMEIPEQMQACAANLRKIHAAIKKYEQDTGQLPAWLSDLVPDYVSKEMLMCPNNPETQVPWPVDPKLPCGYAYEFSPFRAYARFGGAPTDGMTQRDRKMAQVAFFGDVVPLCRCRLHGQTWLNVSVGGESYVSGPQWESTIMPDYKVGSELAARPLPPAESAVE